MTARPDLDAIAARARIVAEYGSPSAEDTVLRDDVPALLREVRRLTAELETARTQAAADVRNRAYAIADNALRTGGDLRTVRDRIDALALPDAPAHEHDAVAAARREERERCARTVTATAHRDSDPIALAFAADRIRALPDAAPACGADVDVEGGGSRPCVRPAGHHDIGPCNNRWPEGLPPA